MNLDEYIKFRLKRIIKIKDKEFRQFELNRLKQDLLNKNFNSQEVIGKLIQLQVEIINEMLDEIKDIHNEKYL
jgi:hypothetical protein